MERTTHRSEVRAPEVAMRGPDSARAAHRCVRRSSGFRGWREIPVSSKGCEAKARLMVPVAGTGAGAHGVTSAYLVPSPRGHERLPRTVPSPERPRPCPRRCPSTRPADSGASTSVDMEASANITVEACLEVSRTAETGDRFAPVCPRGFEPPPTQTLGIIGAPGRTRTPDRRLRRPLLYPPELRGPAPLPEGCCPKAVARRLLPEGCCPKACCPKAVARRLCARRLCARRLFARRR